MLALASGGVITASVRGAARAQDGRAARAATIDWRTDLEAARAEARDADKPLLVVFRCPP